MRLLWAIVSVMIVFVGAIAAQEAEDVVLVEQEITPFGLQATIPEGWTAAGPGAFARQAQPADLVTLVVQAAPLPRQQIITALLPQLGISELPDATETIETDFGTWELRIFDISVQSLELTIHLAFTGENSTTLVLLQAPPDEAPALAQSVFYPVIDSVQTLVAEEEPAALPYASEDVTFDNGDVTLAATLTLPEAEQPVAALVLVTGSGPQNRDEDLSAAGINFAPFAQIADRLTRAGYAVLRYDDRGVAASTGDYATATYDDFVSDATAAVDYLLTREEVASDQIILLGHSEGGLIAPRIAQESENVAGIVLMAGPVVSLYDTILVQNELLLAADGASDERIDAQVAAQRAFLDAIAAGEAPETIRPVLIDLLTIQLGSEPDTATVDMFLAQFTAPLWENALNYEPADAWAQVDLPVLAIYGGLDLQVDAAQNLAVIESLIAEDNLTLLTIDDANHLFQAAQRGTVAEYATLDPVVMPEFTAAILDWLGDTVR